MKTAHVSHSLAQSFGHHYLKDLRAVCVVQVLRSLRDALLLAPTILPFLFIKLQIQFMNQRLLPLLSDVFCRVELNHLAFRDADLANQTELLVGRMAHAGVSRAETLPKGHLKDQVVLPLRLHQFCQSYMPQGRLHGYCLWKPDPGRDWHPFSPIDALEYNGDFLNGRQVREDAKRIFEVEVIYADL